MAERRVLVVDDEVGILEVCSDILRKIPSVEVVTETDGRKAVERISAESFDLLITDIRLPGMNGIELLRLAKEAEPNLSVLVFTAFPTVDTAVEALKIGAADYVIKPFQPDELQTIAARLLDEKQLRVEHGLLQRQVERDYRFDEIIGASAPMNEIFDTISRVADTEADVLITGETGVGKELVARSIHKRSRRRGARFVAVDCAAIPENLMESQFFGHEKGAFTGADTQMMGLLEFAESGTFFLDEVAELSVSLQAKLLRALQERSFRRVGGKKEIKVDIRVLVATRIDLTAAMRAGTFREDLYYRVNVVHIEVPPLRERRSDIPLLATHFVERYAQEMGRSEPCIDAECLDVLSRAPWAGNVRELQNVVKRTLVLARDDQISVDDLPDEVVIQAGEQSAPEGFFQLRSERMDSFEHEYFTDLLRRFEGDVSSAAKHAQLPRGTFYRLLKKHTLTPEDFRT